MRFWLIALVIVGLALAFGVSPAFQATKDSGGESLPKLNVGLGVDCDSKALTVTVTSNETGGAVEGADIYLFYTDYEYRVIGRGKTGADGVGELKVVGNPNYLTALFILRVDKPAYRSKEIEFSYRKCFEAPPKAPKNTTPPANATPPANTTQPPNQSGNTAPPANATPPENATGPGPNASGNATQPKPPANNGSGPQTGNGQPGTPPAPPCLPALLVPLAVFAASMRDWHAH